MSIARSLRARGGLIRLEAAAVVVVLIALAVPAVASAQVPGVFEVTTTAEGDDGECMRDCTLREAVGLATTAGSSISVPAGVYRLTAGPLTVRDVVILGAGIIAGQGAGARTTVFDARGRSRVIVVPAGTSSVLAGVTIKGGAAPTGAGALVESGGTLQLFNAAVEDSAATTRGGGIAAGGTVALANSTVTGNRVAAGSGGGVSVDVNGDLILVSSTITGNSATVNGGGVTAAGTISSQGSTIAGNSAENGGGIFQEPGDGASVSAWNTIIAAGASGTACGGAIATHGFFRNNLATDTSCAFAGAVEGAVGDPRLGALRNNGGATDTRALGEGSPAIDGGDPNLCGGPDQRGANRVGNCDIGAFEFGGRPPEIQLPPPEPGETVNVSRARGVVKVKLPGSDEFFELQDGQQVPVGTTFDTSRGRVTLEAAGRQRAWFYQGVFKLGQTRGARPQTTLSLTGRLSCGRGNAAATAQRRKKKRRLWGDGKGRFRTKGRHSAATVVGTKWLVEDRCNGTLTKVRRGKVRVTRRGAKPVVLRAGEQFFARRRR